MSCDCDVPIFSVDVEVLVLVVVLVLVDVLVVVLVLVEVLLEVLVLVDVVSVVVVVDVLVLVLVDVVVDVVGLVVVGLVVGLGLVVFLVGLVVSGGSPASHISFSPRSKVKNGAFLLVWPQSSPKHKKSPVATTLPVVISKTPLVNTKWAAVTLHMTTHDMQCEHHARLDQYYYPY